MVDEKTCVWMVLWRNDEGFMEWEYHLLHEGAQSSYERIKKDSNTKIVMLTAVKEWFIK